MDSQSTWSYIVYHIYYIKVKVEAKIQLKFKSYFTWSLILRCVFLKIKIGAGGENHNIFIFLKLVYRIIVWQVYNNWNKSHTYDNKSNCKEKKHIQKKKKNKNDSKKKKKQKWLNHSFNSFVVHCTKLQLIYK